MAETSFNLLNLSSIVEPTRLSAILGISAAQIYLDKQKGLFGDKDFTDLTYLDAIRLYRANLVKSVEVKLAKEETNRQIELKKIEERKKLRQEKSKIDYDSGEDTLHPLVRQKMECEIKNLKIKEIQEWIKIAENRKELINLNELEKLLLPFVLLIKNSLVSLSLEFPEMREKIDQNLNYLADFGLKLLEQCEADSDEFISDMLEKSYDSSLIEETFTTFQEKL